MKNILLLFLLFTGKNLLATYSDGKTGFTVKINGEINPYSIYSVFVMPESTIEISSEQDIQVKSPDFSFMLVSNNQWIGSAPAKTGLYQFSLTAGEFSTMQINVLVLTPMTQAKGEYFNGYRIGTYPSKPLNGNKIYERPEGLFEVTESNSNINLTPHFKLSQFVCKQAGGYPKYLIIREKLLLKLEYLLEETNEAGYPIETFGFISGYRTPFYNKSIKNVQYSRHVYGGAADIIIDMDHDGHMDDLNADGKIDEQDVSIFHSLVDSQYDLPEYKEFRGGLGFYKKNSVHKGFIHVDVRGTKARWGHPGS